MSSQEQFEEYEKYVAAGATWPMLKELEVKEEEPLVELEQGRERDTTRRMRLYWQGIQLGSIAPFTLERPAEDPLFFASESPFAVLDELLAAEKKVERLIVLAAEKKVERLIDFIRDKSKIQFAEELAARLILLCQAAKEEDPEKVSISHGSLRYFIVFLLKAPNLRYPDVVLTPSNEIRAQWRTAPNRHFAVVFLPTREARFVIFTPNRRDPYKIDRLSGITSVDTLMETAEPHGVLEWASQ